MTFHVDEVLESDMLSVPGPDLSHEGVRQTARTTELCSELQ
jgi:hypothetical protein